MVVIVWAKRKSILIWFKVQYLSIRLSCMLLQPFIRLANRHNGERMNTRVFLQHYEHNFKYKADRLGITDRLCLKTKDVVVTYAASSFQTNHVSLFLMQSAEKTDQPHPHKHCWLHKLSGQWTNALNNCHKIKRLSRSVGLLGLISKQELCPPLPGTERQLITYSSSS